MMMSTVTDPERNGKLTLTLRNYFACYKDVVAEELDKILPEGMFLAVKNPKNVPLRLICDNPGEIQLLSAKDVERIMGSGFKASSPFWQRRKKEEEEEAFFFDKLKQLGNRLFALDCYSEAVRFYDLALQYAPTVVDKSITLSNKAAALLRMRCHSAALTISKLAIHLYPRNVKAVYRMGQALLGLGRFQEAAKEYTAGAIPALVKENVCLKDMLRAINDHSRRPTTLLPPEEYITLNKCLHRQPLHSLPVEQRAQTLHEVVEGVAEYIGPVEVKPCENRERGRGLFATQNISPGQVILISRAINATLEDWPTGFLREKMCLDSPATAAFMTQIANQILVDPAVGACLYQLSAGKSLGFLPKDDERASLVDMDRIKGIMSINASHPRDAEYNHSTVGVWFLPSFVNHSCSERNCVFEYYADVLIAKAVETIPKGTEILRSYISKQLPFERRQELLKRYGFTCTCKLCTFDRKEDGSLAVLKRKRILGYLTDIEPCDRPGDLGKYDLRKLLMDLNFMEMLWAKNPLPGLFYSSSVGCIGTYLCGAGSFIEQNVGDEMERRPYQEAFRTFKFTLSIAEHGNQRILAIMAFCHCLLSMKSKKLVLQYLKMLKNELVLWYGSLDGMNVFEDEGFLEKVEQRANEF